MKIECLVSKPFDIPRIHYFFVGRNILRFIIGSHGFLLGSAKL